MKNFKTKKIVLGTVVALSAVSLASVGFANWIINGIADKDVGNINVNFGNINDTSIVTECTSTADDLTVRFDNKATSSVKVGDTFEDGKLIFANSEDKVEKLTFTVKFTIKTTGTSTVDNLFDKITFTFKQSEKFKECVDAGYIVSPFSNYSSVDSDDFVTSTCEYSTPTTPVTDTGTGFGTSSKLKDNNKTREYFAIFSFKWGTAFKGHNPCFIKDGEKEADFKTNLHAFRAKIADFSASLNILPSKK